MITHQSALWGSRAGLGELHDAGPVALLLERREPFLVRPAHPLHVLQQGGERAVRNHRHDEAGVRRGTTRAPDEAPPPQAPPRSRARASRRSDRRNPSARRATPVRAASGRVELAVPPERAPFFCSSTISGLEIEQLADHARRVGLVAGLDLLSEHGAADYTRSRRSGASLRALLTRARPGGSRTARPPRPEQRRRVGRGQPLVAVGGRDEHRHAGRGARAASFAAVVTMVKVAIVSPCGAAPLLPQPGERERRAGGEPDK